MESHLAECLLWRRGRRGRHVGLDLVPDEFEFGDEFATVGRRRCELVHGIDKRGYVAAFSFGAGEIVLLFPSIPSHVNSGHPWYRVACEHTISPLLFGPARCYRLAVP